jgi:Fibronectin type III domain
MNGKYLWKCIGRVVGLVSISVVLAACDGSNGNTANNGPVTSDPASSAVDNNPTPSSTADSVTVSWEAPSENTNGTALTNLAGYEIHYGTSATALTESIAVDTVGVTDYVVSNLSSGTWYFEIVAVNSDGTQSAPSGVVSMTI